MHKHYGLSQLADVASTTDHYPIRQRGQKRRLNPNQAAIDWLEEATATETEITETYPLDETGPWASLLSLRPLGWHSARRAGHHPRRMFDVFNPGASSGSPVSSLNPCRACLDFSRSWNCPDHPERPWNPETRTADIELAAHISGMIEQFLPPTGSSTCRTAPSPSPSTMSAMR